MIIVLICGPDNKCFSSPKFADWLWGPPSLLHNGYEQNDWGMKLTSHLHLVPRLRISAALLLTFLGILMMFSASLTVWRQK
jgi:hypothetical protein